MDKAWQISDYTEEYGDVVFCATEEQAMSKGAASLDTDDEHVNCTRAPEFDKFADLGYVPPNVLVEQHGWWWECNHCGTGIGGGNENTNNMILLGRVIYCSASCRADFTKKNGCIAEQFDEFKWQARDLYPELELVFSGGYPILTPSASFKFPGSKYTGGMLKMDTIGDLALHMANGDMDAWTKYRG